MRRMSESPICVQVKYEHMFNKVHSGQEDMNVEGMWQRMGISVDNPRQYHL